MADSIPGVKRVALSLPFKMGKTMTVRDDIQSAIREAAEQDDKRRLCTLRLIQTAIRDRDAAHCAGNGEKISASDVAALLRIRKRAATSE
ncbi:MAG: hypothetical protein AAFW98_06365, partial [Pseudomonadota bacterium]